MANVHFRYVIYDEQGNVTLSLPAVRNSV